jgi:hypothetical protein
LQEAQINAPPRYFFPGPGLDRPAEKVNLYFCMLQRLRGGRQNKLRPEKRSGMQV